MRTLRRLPGLLLAGALLTPAILGEPRETPPARPMAVREAVDLALLHALPSRMAAEKTVEAHARALEALAPLLPSLTATTARSDQTANRAAMGLPGGFLGPYGTFDARLRMAWSVLNLGAWQRMKAGREDEEAAKLAALVAHRQVTAATILAYVSASRAQAAVDAARADLDLARRLLDLARSRHDAGAATGLDVTRAEVRCAREEGRVAVAASESRKASLRLLRWTGLPQETSLILTDSMPTAPAALPDAEEAVNRALRSRAEVQLAECATRTAERLHRATRADRLPSVDVVGDYGLSGAKIDENALPTRSIGVRVTVPLFTGGALSARGAAASSRSRQRRLELEDLRLQVEEDVRSSLQTLSAATVQVEAAQRARSLAEREVEQARDRFESGVADNIEVTTAQAALADARDTEVAARAALAAAREELAAALGDPEEYLKDVVSPDNAPRR